jgi:hypothetical protein
MERVTVKQLRRQCELLNTILGIKDAKWSTVGAYRIDASYVGNGHPYHVERIVNKSGGVTCPFGHYRLTAWECYHVLQTAIRCAQDESWRK